MNYLDETGGESNFDALFERARSLSPSEQLEFAQRECRNEDERQRLLELLAALQEIRNESFANPMLPDNVVVQAFEAAAEDSTSPGISRADSQLKPGKFIGPYKILELIGEGGMGSVFVAEQTEPVSRRVALKVIKSGIDSNDTLARFEAERQALSMMDHPNIAKVLDAGTTDPGRPYFVMELVKGIPITDYCDQNKLSANLRLGLFVAVCQAISHAHQKGIIHRDIKPSNVLVAEYDDEPVPKVIDFGVAKATTLKLTDKTIYTRFGQLVGTFEYMSPEQAKLNQLDVDTRSDVYSLGVLLYELLTSTTPFDRKRLRSAALNELIRIISEEDPPKPSTRLTSEGSTAQVASNRGVDPQQLLRTMRGELDWIVMRSLEKDRKRRYQSASGFAKDIQRYLQGDAVEACPPTLAYQTKKFVLRNRVQVAIASALFLLLLISSAAGWIAYSATNDKYAALQNETRVQSAIRLAAESEANGRILHPIANMQQAIRAVETTYQHDGTVLEIARQKLQDSLGRLGGRLLVSHNGHIGSVSISSDGRWLVAGGDEDGLFLSDLRDLESEPTRLPHRNATKVQFASDMRWIVTAGLDGVMLWRFDGPETVNSGVRLIDPDDERKQVTRLVISGDSRWAAVSFYGGYVHIWDLQADDPTASERIISVHADATLQGSCLAINNDGTRFATACSNGRIFLWDLTRDQLEPLRNFSHQRTIGSRLALSSDGRWFAMSNDGHSKLWDLSRPEADALALDGDETNDVGFSDDDKYLVVGGEPCFLYDLTAKDILGSRIALDVDGSAPTLSPGNRWLVNQKGSVIQLWNLGWLEHPMLPTITEVDGTQFRIWSPTKSSGNTISLYGHDERITAIRFTPDDSALISGSWDGSARLWKLDQTNPAGNHAFRSVGTIQCTGVSPDGKWLAVGRKGTTSRLWPLRKGEGLSNAYTLKNATDGIGKVAFSPDSHWLVGTSVVPTFRDENGFARNEQVAHVWDLRSAFPGKQAFELPHGGAVTSLVFDPSGTCLITGCTDGIMRVWSMADQQEERLVAEFSSPSSHSPEPEQADAEQQESALEGKAAKQMIVDVANDGWTAVSGTGQGEVLVWDLRDDGQTKPKKLRGMDACPLDVAISPDGRWVAAGGAYEASYAWDLTARTADTGIRIPSFWKGSFFTNVDFTPDGRWLLTGSWDKTTNLFDLQKSQPFAEPARTIRHTSAVQTLSVSAGGYHFVSGSEAIPTVIDLTQFPSQLKKFSLPVEAVRATALTPDGKRAITGTQNEVRIWELDTESMLSVAKSRLGRGR